ncbi:hypothetical protein [Streptomyces sp. NPDC086777]|uniref:hypothetical protein n=1 Tax=Streptomyces sp. NPDC086777 TaxID=3154866 RepID=UPI00344FC136
MTGRAGVPADLADTLTGDQGVQGRIAAAHARPRRPYQHLSLAAGSGSRTSRMSP